MRIGDHIPYVICKGNEESFAERAYHPDQVKKDNLPIGNVTSNYLLLFYFRNF